MQSNRSKYFVREKNQVKKRNSKLGNLAKEWWRDNWMFSVMFCACLLMLILALGVQK